MCYKVHIAVMLKSLSFENISVHFCINLYKSLVSNKNVQKCTDRYGNTQECIKMYGNVQKCKVFFAPGYAIGLT